MNTSSQHDLKKFFEYFPEFSTNIGLDLDLRSLIKSWNLGHGGHLTQSSPLTFVSDSSGNVSFVHQPEFEESDQIRQAILSIHPFHRAPFVLLHILEKPYAQLHKFCGVAPGSVMSSLHYARRTLVPDISRWDLPSNDYLIDCGAIADGGLEVPDQPTYQRILEEDARLVPYMNFVKNLKVLIRNKLVTNTTPPQDEQHQ